MTPTTYQEALDYIHSLQRFGMKPGLLRVSELLRRLGNPHHAPYRTLHITGTNGKGSVSALCEAALRAAGLSTGLFISPYLEEFTERIQFDRRPIEKEALAALAAEVIPAVQAMVADGHEQPTEFEVITAIAFLAFARRPIDALVLEVGLGGRFDSTNVIAAPEVAVITSIALDHTQVLGTTLEAIAWDKAGIIKPGRPCVVGPLAEGPLGVVEQVAAEQGSRLVHVAGGWEPEAFSLEGQRFHLQSPRRLYRNLSLGLLGEHQVANAACAVAALEEFGLEEAAIRQGLDSARWPARFEVLRRDPLIVLDCAHNPAGARALARTVRTYLPGRPVTLLIGIFKDKDVAGVLEALLPLAQQVVATQPAGPRALPADELAQRLRCPAAADPAEALRLALQRLPPGGCLLIAGSVNLAGILRPLLRA